MNRLVRRCLAWVPGLLGTLGAVGAWRAQLACGPAPETLGLGAGAVLGLGGLLLWALAWWGMGLALGLPTRAGRQSAQVGAGAWSMAWLWPLVQRVHLPPPQNVPERPLQILLAGALFLGLALALALFLRTLLRAGALAHLSPRSAALRLGGLAWVLYLLGSLWTWRWLMTGDAPHYMLISAALAKEGSLDLSHLYYKKEWRRYYDLKKDLEPSAIPLRNGRMISEHRPLLPLLGAQGYRWGGFAGALWIQTLLGGLGTGLFYLLLRQRGMAPRMALIGWSLLALSAPWILYSQIFIIEVLGGVLAVLWLLAWEGAVPEAWAWLVPMALPWLGTRLVVAGAGASLAWAWAWRKQPWKAVRVGAFFALSAMGTSLSNKLQMGDASLQAFYNARGTGLSYYFSLVNAPRYLSGLLIDQEFGLLPWAPALLLAAAGLGLWVRRRDSMVLPLLAWALPYLGLISCFNWWYGDMAPARYLIPLVPLAALLAVEGFEALEPLAWPWILLGLGWVLAWVLEVLPWFCFSKKQGECWPLRLLGSALGLRLTSYFPSFIINTPQSYLWSLGLVLAAARLAWHPALPRSTPH